MNFQKILDYAKARGHYRMCAPIAMALTTCESFDDCDEMLRLLGFRRDKRQGTMRSGIVSALRELGYHTRRYGVPSHIKTNITLKGKLDSNKKYLIEYSGHVAAYINGNVEDWSEGRRYRVTGIIEVIQTEGEVGLNLTSTMGDIY